MKIQTFDKSIREASIHQCLLFKKVPYVEGALLGNELTQPLEGFLLLRAKFSLLVCRGKSEVFPLGVKAPGRGRAQKKESLLLGVNGGLQTREDFEGAGLKVELPLVRITPAEQEEVGEDSRGEF